MRNNLQTTKTSYYIIFIQEYQDLNCPTLKMIIVSIGLINIMGGVI